MRMAKGLTASVVFQAQSLNYDEGIANISVLKKLTRGDGTLLTFASRQAIRYDIVRLGHEMYNWNLQVVDKSKGTVQFRDDMSIKDSVEMDLFGYMKTAKKSDSDAGGANTRPAVVRLSHAISLEPYRSDTEFLTNKGLADRIGEHPNIANIEQHLSFYTYTFTIDLDKVGIDHSMVLDNKERAERVNQFLEVVKMLNRNIRGRQENLSPVFIIGGIYDLSSPFFLGRIGLNAKGGVYYIQEDRLNSVLQMTVCDTKIVDNTYAGIADGYFANDFRIKEMLGNKAISVEGFINTMKDKVNEFYGASSI
jgi:CRISPR-associated protein Cst2